MGLLVQALDAGWALLEGERCAQRSGGVLVVQIDHCPCQYVNSACPVRLAMGDGQARGHVLILDAEHRIVGINRAAPGLVIDDVLGQVPYERPDMAPAAQDAVRTGLRRALERGYLEFFEFDHVRPNGERVTWVAMVTPLVAPDGLVTGFRLEMATARPARQTSGVSWAPVRSIGNG